MHERNIAKNDFETGGIREAASRFGRMLVGLVAPNPKTVVTAIVTGQSLPLFNTIKVDSAEAVHLGGSDMPTPEFDTKTEDQPNTVR